MCAVRLIVGKGICSLNGGKHPQQHILHVFAIFRKALEKLDKISQII